MIMRKFIALVLIITGYMQSSRAQVTVTRDDYYFPGEWYFFGNDSVIKPQWNALLAGSTNANWDISNAMSSNSTDTVYIENGLTYPTAPAGCNLVEKTVNTETQEVSEQFFYADSSGVKIVLEAGSEFPITGSLKIINFPSTFNTAINDSLQNVQTFLASDFGIPANPLTDSLRIVINLKLTALVDGYGTLKITAGSFDCLRQKLTIDVLAKFFIRNKITGTYSPFTLIPDQTQKQVAYTWYGKNSGNFYLQANLDSMNNITDIKYMLASSRGVTNGINKSDEVTELNIFPNPASNYLNLTFNSKTSEAVSVNCYNLAGQKMFTVNNQVNFGSNHIKVNTEELTNGVYFYEVTGNNIKFSGKFIK